MYEAYYEEYKNLLLNKIIILAQVPIELRNEEICLSGINEYNLHLIPKKIWSRDFAMRACIKKKYVMRSPLYSSKYLTNDFCLEVLKHNGAALECVPENMITEELCMIAINNNIGAKKYIPKKYLTEKMYIHILKYTHAVHIPKKFAFRYSDVLRAIRIRYYDHSYYPFQIRFLYNNKYHRYIFNMLFIKN